MAKTSKQKVLRVEQVSCLWLFAVIKELVKKTKTKTKSEDEIKKLRSHLHMHCKARALD